jgi:uncharacterized DUF497 family protein
MKPTTQYKQIAEPEWAREKQITSQFGLTHMILYTLRREGKIRSVSLRSEGKKQGARLYHVQSVREYLSSLEDKGCGAVD